MSEAPAFQRLDESGRRSHRPDGVGRRRPDTDTKHVADADHPLSLGLGLAKQRLDIAGEGTPYFDVESGYAGAPEHRSEEHTSELQSLMRISYAVFCLKKKTKNQKF